MFGVSIADFADGLLSRILNRVVIDKTGEAGVFDLQFEFTANDATPLGGPPPAVAAARRENRYSIFPLWNSNLASSCNPIRLP